jgi:hypothetical protein
MRVLRVEAGSSSPNPSGVLAAQCLDQRVPDKQAMVDQVADWTSRRNAANAEAAMHDNWRPHQAQEPIPSA